jgi:hypothetical protein
MYPSDLVTKAMALFDGTEAWSGVCATLAYAAYVVANITYEY